MFLTAGGAPPGTNPPPGQHTNSRCCPVRLPIRRVAWLANAARLQQQNNGIQMTQTYGIRGTAAHPKQQQTDNTDHGIRRYDRLILNNGW